MKKIDSVLLIDDDKFNNFLNYRLLKKVNPVGEIKIAENGEEALTYLNAKDSEVCPQVIFLDINMPGMNGFEFIDSFKNLKVCKTQPRIFMLTTSTDINDLMRLENYPEIKGFVNKPLTENKLRQVIEKYFE